MLVLRPASQRGHADHGWLEARHTFSFAGYHDPEHMGFRSLRVMNEDRVAPGQGFGMHPHRDMEIVTYVISGQLEHRDSMGNGSILKAGEVQAMTAGTGILHSEMNPSHTEPVHLYQTWIKPDRKGLPPSYSQLSLREQHEPDRLRLFASNDARDGSLKIHQDAAFYAARLTGRQPVRHPMHPNRYAWVQVVDGSAGVNGQGLAAGDGVAISGVTSVDVEPSGEAELLLIELA